MLALTPHGLCMSSGKAPTGVIYGSTLPDRPEGGCQKTCKKNEVVLRDG